MQLSHMRSMQPRAATHRVLLPTPAAVAPAVCASARHNKPSPAMQPSLLQPLQMGNTIQQQQHQRQRYQQQQWAPLPPVQAASGSSSDSSSSSSDPKKPQPGLTGLNWFDRLPQQTQLMVMGGFLFIGAIVIPFFQPTFLYGDGSMDAGNKPGSGQITQVQENPYTKKDLPRYIPVASELYSFLQDNAMPKQLPDGRSDSPGVLRIYMASMVILAVFYACSAVLSLILRGVAGILRAVGVMGPAPPPPKPEAS